MQNIKILVVAQLLSKRPYLLKYISGTKQQMYLTGFLSFQRDLSHPCYL